LIGCFIITLNMKKLFFAVLFLVAALAQQARANNENLSGSGNSVMTPGQDADRTATTRASTRLFKSKDDLTSVITIIPAGSVVTFLDADSTYMHVVFDENEGYIFRKHATIDKVPAQVANPAEQQANDNQPAQDQPDERYSYLANKYGQVMADRIYAGKIWKGMNSDMVKDSWGTAMKINREVNGNTIREEWIYRSTWLYFENNTLVQWGPTKKE
jgi:hypothetical protein